MPAWQFGPDDPIPSQRLHVETASRGGQAFRHCLVPAVKSPCDEFLAFGQKLLNQEIQE